MARIAGIDIPNKRIVIALTYIYGIGLSTSKKILADVSLSEDIRANDLSEEDLNKLRNVISEMTVEGDLRQKVAADIHRLKSISCYRGRRHNLGLPCRGQKTKVNCKTRRGKRGRK